MTRTGFITHPDCRLHNQPGHPEHAGRTMAIEKYISESDLNDHLIYLGADKATSEQVALTHSRDFIATVEKRVRERYSSLDPDTYINEHSFDAALLSFGGGLLAMKKVHSGELDSAFCCLRPPGHHATGDQSMGFCIFNNIAGVAQYALNDLDYGHVAIVDFDVHHGNGTQSIFYDSAAVHYTSLHQYPYYPGSGSADETGDGKGEGYTMNIPLAVGTDGGKALELFSHSWPKVMDSFKPDLVLISAGFDAHREDPLAGLRFEDNDYLTFTQIIVEIAVRHCAGKVISLLEGGYNLNSLARSVYQHLKGLIDG